jgi:hypothetical protein
MIVFFFLECEPLFLEDLIDEGEYREVALIREELGWLSQVIEEIRQINCPFDYAILLLD